MQTDEKHFNELQLKVRGIASTWILAGFGAIAYFIKTNQPVLEYFSTLTMINLVCLMIVIGLFVLWILDQLVYQRLMNANFVAGLYSEYRNQDEPPIRHLMIIASEFKGMSRWYNLFYFLPMTVLTIFSTTACLLETFSPTGDLKEKVASIIIGVFLLLIIALIWRYIFNNKRDTPFYNLMKSFGDEHFLALLNPDQCNEQVRKWVPERAQIKAMSE